MSHHRFALHRITDSAEPGFDPAAYSRFKFGDRAATGLFGKQLAEGFIQAHGERLLQHPEVVFLPSPFNHIPTASYYLSQEFKKTVNRFLHRNKKNALLESKIHRYKTYSEDYGMLSFEERVKLISSDSYHVDTSFLSNRLCIFLDDIRITGSHELIIRKILEQNQVKGQFMYVYFAELCNSEIAPVYENYLNYFYVKGNAEIAELLSQNDIHLNTRTIKYLLNEKNPTDKHVMALPKSTLEKIADYAIGNNYHLMEEYKKNLNQILKHISYGN